MQVQKFHDDGKEVVTNESVDGSKSVTIKVRGLDVNETTPEGIEAKRRIEEEILPRLANTVVRVVVIHKPTNHSTSSRVHLPALRGYLDQVYDSYKALQEPEAMPKDFVVVEIHDNGQIRVTSLEKYGR